MLLTDFLHRQGGLDDLGRRLVVCEAWSFDQRSVLVSVSGWFQSRPYNVSGGFRSYWFQYVSGPAVNDHVKSRTARCTAAKDQLNATRQTGSSACAHTIVCCTSALWHPCNSALVSVLSGRSCCSWRAENGMTANQLYDGRTVLNLVGPSAKFIVARPYIFSTAV
jgi:hypothetical protein